MKKPEKQGGLYSLNLGQNNGPYLTKDIMLTNEKSLKLFSGKDDVTRQAAKILSASLDPYGTMESKGSALDLHQPQDYYDESFKAYMNYDERYKAKLYAAENISSNSKFLENSILTLQKDFNFYKEQIASYRADLETMHEQIHNSNMNNIREIQPLLKEFHTRLKDKLMEGKNDNYTLQRELEQLQREKLQIQQQILFSHKRILDLEKNVLNVKVSHIDPMGQQNYKQIDEQEEVSRSDSQISDFE